MAAANVADKILRKQFDLLSAPAANVARKVVQTARGAAQGTAQVARGAARGAAQVARGAAQVATEISGGGIRVEHIGFGLMLTALLVLVIVLTQKTDKNSKRE